MEFAQESIATLHDFGAATPSAPVDRASVLVPMIGAEYGTAPAERLFEGLERVDPREVVVPLRARAARAVAIADWLETFSVPVRILWCSGPRITERLEDIGPHQNAGKGRDMWLGLGVARGDYVVFHDADAATYEPVDTYKLLAPLEMGLEGAAPDEPASAFSFVKAYYARVENDRLYGRLTRLFYEPLVAALAGTHDAEFLTYLQAFRYALAGESAMTAPLARSMRVHPRWGFEVASLGEAYAFGGMAGSAQVDLGRYEHEHRSVEGPGSLSRVSVGVAEALFHALADHDVDVSFETLRDRYRRTAYRRIRAYAADSAFNDFEYDAEAERRQVQTYARSVTPPGVDDRLPPWKAVSLSADAVVRATRADLDGARDGETAASGESTGHTER